MTFGLRTVADLIVSASGLPVTVMTFVSRKRSMRFSTAGMPPAAQRSWMPYGPFGLTASNVGMWSAASNSASVNGTSAACAIAGRCSAVLVDAPIDIAVATALRNAAGVNICRALSPSRAMATMRSPVARAAASLSACQPGMLLLPGRQMPKASARHWNVLAVPMISQAPQVEQVADLVSRLRSCFRSP